MEMMKTAQKGWLTPKMRTWVWGFGIGVAAATLGVNINWGDLSGLGNRVKSGVEAISTPQTTEPVAVAP